MTNQPPSERTMLEALAAGDAAGFAAVFDRMGGRLLKTARGMLGPDGEAEDAVQDVFVELVRRRDRLGAVRDLEAYLFSMLRHEVGRRIKRLKRDRLWLQQVSVLETQPGDAHTARLEAEELSAAVARLPVAQREVIVMKVHGELSFAQIAEILNVSINTAASRYRYALEKLRRELDA